MLWSPLVEAYVINMLCCGNSRWKGEIFWWRASVYWDLKMTDSIFNSSLCRRRQLADLGSATGVYKTLMKYLVGVPEVGLSLFNATAKCCLSFFFYVEFGSFVFSDFFFLYLIFAKHFIGFSFLSRSHHGVSVAGFDGLCEANKRWSRVYSCI